MFPVAEAGTAYADVRDGGEIDAITAATISSRAFLDAINIAYFGLIGNLDAITSATEASETDSKTD